jgi:TPR repeat protein
VTEVLAKEQLKKIDEILKWYNAAKHGDTIAQIKIAEIYSRIKTFFKDFKDKASTARTKWYRKAAEQGNEFALEELKKLGETL